VIEPNYKLLFQDLINSGNGISSDLRHLLRITLLIGASEAQRRIFINVGEASREYRRIMHGLVDLGERVDDMFDDRGCIRTEYRMTVFEAVEICERLSMIDKAETKARYSRLKSALANSLCENCRGALLVAQKSIMGTPPDKVSCPASCPCYHSD